MKGIYEVKISIVEEVTNSAVLLCNIVVRELWQKLTKVLPLGIRQDFTPRTFAHNREEDFGLLQTKLNISHLRNI